MPGILHSTIGKSLHSRMRANASLNAHFRRPLFSLAKYAVIQMAIAGLIQGVCRAEGELQTPTELKIRLGDVKLFEFEPGTVSVASSRLDLLGTHVVSKADASGITTKVGVLL